MVGMLVPDDRWSSETMSARRIIFRYLLLIGLAANLALLGLLVVWSIAKVQRSDMYKDLRRSWMGPLDGVQVEPIVPAAPGTINPSLVGLPAKRWIKIHEQRTDDPHSFDRQVHSGAAFDPVRGRLMLFGSDTHRVNWDNQVRFFDMAALAWSGSYLADDPDTYDVNADGVPVAGAAGNHPWAMHTFDAVEYDPIGDRLIVASHPEHLHPGKSWGMSADVWRRIKRHPTWVYRVAENRWEYLPGKAVSFFPYATTFDPIRRVVIGVKPDGYWELDGEPLEWKRVAKGAPQAWHVAAAYDWHREIVVAFGTHTREDSVWQYRRGDDNGRRMPTPGLRPPGADSAPLVYHPGARRVVALVEERGLEGQGRTGTWLYDTAEDRWSRLETGDLPFQIGMNYHMVYDPGHELLVLVANMPGEPVAVWVMRLPSSQQSHTDTDQRNSSGKSG